MWLCGEVFTCRTVTHGLEEADPPILSSPALALQGPSVLLLHADSEGTPTLQAELIATGQFSGVSELDVSDNGILPLESDLVGFDVILCYSDLPFQDETAIGDLLADRVDAGQALVVGPAASSISNNPAGIALRGR